jgi:hypothetical protein
LDTHGTMFSFMLMFMFMLLFMFMFGNIRHSSSGMDWACTARTHLNHVSHSPRLSQHPSIGVLAVVVVFNCIDANLNDLYLVT